MSTTLSLSYSPCPNDTFIFSDIASGKLTVDDVDFDISLHDIDELNKAALEQRYDIIKVSCYNYLHIRNNYNLLDTGAAVGYGNGPLLLSSKVRSLNELKHCRIAFPGNRTTAYLLFQLLGIEIGDQIFISYEEIIPQLKAGLIDCGVIIHESRFTYEQSGLHCICDLGKWWENETGLPIPLGCIVIKNTIDDTLAMNIETLIRRSLSERNLDSARTDQYILDNAQEMDPLVLNNHIELYVNEFTKSLGKAGHQAINVLADRSKSLGLIP